MDMAVSDNPRPTIGNAYATVFSDLIAQTGAVANGNVRHWLHVARLAREAGRLDEARALLIAASDRFPQEAWVPHDLAKVAEASQDWPEAERLWRAFSVLNPAAWFGPTQVAVALRNQGRTKEAEAILADAVESFPREAGPFIEYARIAEMRRDWTEASKRWLTATERFPQFCDGLVGQARALREQRQPERAKDLLVQAAEQHPSNAGPLHELARLAEVMRNWTAAERWWRVVVAIDPDRWWPYTGLAAALKEQGSFDQSAEVLADAMARFPSEPEPAVVFARLAERAAQWPEAIKRWDDVCQRFPHVTSGPIGLSHALYESGETSRALTVLQAATKHFPRAADVHDRAARMAHLLGQRDQAMAYVHHALKLEPRNQSHYLHLSQLHTDAGDIAQAEAVLTQGIAAAGHSVHFHLGLAGLAQRKADWSQAVRHYRECLQRFPGEASAVTGLATALAYQGDQPSAEAMLQEAIRQHPERVDYALAFARLSTAGQPDRYKISLRRAREVLKKFPHSIEAHQVVAHALLINHLNGEAAELLRSAIDRFGSERSIAQLLATALVRHGDSEQALIVFADLAKNFPADQGILRDYADALIAARQWDVAKTLIEQATERFPANHSFGIAMLDILIAQNDLTAATSVWRSLATKAEADSTTKRELFERRGLLLGLGIDPAGTESLIEIDGDDLPIQEIVKVFESLGGTGIGCEFGLFQRFYGAEPLGLLRWTTIHPHELLDALKAEFAGVGTPEQTILRSPEHGDHIEYSASDRRFGMLMHTFVRADQVPPDKMFVQLCRRLSFLRTKLLDDLREGNKVFVYKNQQTISDEEIRALYQEMRRYGNPTFMYVRPEDPLHPFPLVEMWEPGLLVGYIDKFSIAPDGSERSLPATSWAAVAKNAYRLWRDTRPSTST
jgi:tetratricopeptide (TPR) repeat protein